MSKPIRHISCEKAENLLDHLSGWNKQLELDQFIFRGLSNSDHELIPKALRECEQDIIYQIGGDTDTAQGDRELASSQQLIEWKVLRKFYQVCDRNGLSVPNIRSLREDVHLEDALPRFDHFQAGRIWPAFDYLELLGLAQHYGLPTRLLDWTNDPMTACFMACYKPNSESSSISVWALNRHLLGQIPESEAIDGLQFVTPNYHGNANLAAQSGTFTVILEHAQLTLGSATKGDLSSMKINRSPLDQKVSNIMANNSQQIDQTAMIKYSLPKGEIARLRRILKSMNYGVSKHFPGYQGVVDQLGEF